MTDQDEFKLEYWEQDGGWFWKVTATGNHEIIAQSEEPGGFATKQNAERNFKLVQRALLTL
jgi:uncharacterized protein YegP (UPF0339 family)